MVHRGILNSRMKDFHDIWMLSRSFDFQGAVLAEAIAKTFANRNTEVPADAAAFAPSFAEEREKVAQWRGFIRKSGLSGAPDSFTDAVAAIRDFLEPVATAISQQRKFHGTWKAPGPWR
jgi:hypothetical protein